MGILKKINSLFRNKSSKDFLESLEDILIESGLSTKLSKEIMDTLESTSAGFSTVEKIQGKLKQILLAYALAYPIVLHDEPHLYLFVGVNGVGKTTTIAKCVYYLLNKKNIPLQNIVVAAGDTFRAGAIEQIQIHCDRLGVNVIKQQAGADPAAVIYDTIKYARSKNINYILADTAGRMNTRKDLILQLEKIYRISNKELLASQISSHIVLDGNSGQNTLSQVEDFSEAITINSAILSKYDGNSRGGTLLSIAEKYKLPCSFLGHGEKLSDLKEFNPEQFIDEFLSF